ncbi:Mucin-12 [Xylographa opegraphella]|nr:Mucin-12 [Xylographa opegraphella]
MKNVLFSAAFAALMSSALTTATALSKIGDLSTSRLSARMAASSMENVAGEQPMSTCADDLAMANMTSTRLVEIPASTMANITTTRPVSTETSVWRMANMTTTSVPTGSRSTPGQAVATAVIINKYYSNTTNIFQSHTVNNYINNVVNNYYSTSIINNYYINICTCNGGSNVTVNVNCVIPVTVLAAFETGLINYYSTSSSVYYIKLCSACPITPVSKNNGTVISPASPGVPVQIIPAPVISTTISAPAAANTSAIAAVVVYASVVCPSCPGLAPAAAPTTATSTGAAVTTAHGSGAALTNAESTGAVTLVNSASAVSPVPTNPAVTSMLKATNTPVAPGSSLAGFYSMLNAQGSSTRSNFASQPSSGTSPAGPAASIFSSAGSTVSIKLTSVASAVMAMLVLLL